MGFLGVVRQRRAGDRKPMVHRRNLDLASGEILDRMVGAMVPLVHFHGLGADRDAEHLMSKTDAEGWNSTLNQRLDYRHGILAGGGRIAGTVGEKNAVRFE